MGRTSLIAKAAARWGVRSTAPTYMGTPATEEQENALKQALETYPIEYSKDGASMDMQRVRWASRKLTAEHKLLSKSGLAAEVALITAQIPKKAMPKPLPSVLGLVSPQPQQ